MREVMVQIEKTLEVPDSFAMFSDEGNNYIGQRICGLVEECDGSVTYPDVYKMLDEIYDNTEYKECYDTEVRECIFGFLEDNNVYLDIT